MMKEEKGKRPSEGLGIETHMHYKARDDGSGYIEAEVSAKVLSALTVSQALNTLQEDALPRLEQHIQSQIVAFLQDERVKEFDGKMAAKREENRQKEKKEKKKSNS